MKILLEILGILCMLTVMFVAIWGFIVAKQTYSQMKYQNYLLEKLTQNIYMLVQNNVSISCNGSKKTDEFHDDSNL